jgi:hypothetical protein
VLLFAAALASPLVGACDEEADTPDVETYLLGQAVTTKHGNFTVSLEPVEGDTAAGLQTQVPLRFKIVAHDDPGPDPGGTPTACWVYPFWWLNAPLRIPAPAAQAGSDAGVWELGAVVFPEPGPWSIPVVFTDANGNQDEVEFVVEVEG